MTQPGVTFSARWVDRRATSVLAQLGSSASVPARRAAMRKALQPVRTALQRAWRQAPTKMKRKHLRAIASRTQIKIIGPRGGVVHGQVGVVYSFGGKQNIWHLLENGWKHPRGKLVAGRRISKSIAVAMLPIATERCAEETMRGAFVSQLKRAGWRAS